MDQVHDIFNFASYTGYVYIDVAALAAEASYGLGEKEAILKAYINILQDRIKYDYMDSNIALNSIDIINESSPELIEDIENLIQYRIDENISGTNAGSEMRTAPCLLHKWGVEIGIPISSEALEPA